MGCLDVIAEPQTNETTSFLVFLIELQAIEGLIIHRGVREVLVKFSGDLYVVVNNVQFVIEQIPLQRFIWAVSGIRGIRN